MRIIVVSALLLAAFPAASQAANATFIADLASVQALGRANITADVTAPADEFIKDGRAQVVIPAKGSGRKVTFRGKFGFKGKGSKRAYFSALELRGSTLSGKYRGRRYAVLNFSNVKRSRKVVTTGGATLSGAAASVLRKYFKNKVFRSGLSFFKSGRIPR